VDIHGPHGRKKKTKVCPYKREWQKGGRKREGGNGLEGGELFCKIFLLVLTSVDPWGGRDDHKQRRKSVKQLLCYHRGKEEKLLGEKKGSGTSKIPRGEMCHSSLTIGKHGPASHMHRER